MKLVVCISGKAQHGKDTFATFLKIALQERNNKVLILHYADYLKFICEKYFNWNGEKDDIGRSLLQKVGTDVVRAKDPDFWVSTAIRFIKMFEEEWDFILIPDCRFPNEIDLISQNFPAMHLRVVRQNFDNGLSEAQKAHISETALDNITPTLYVDNNGSLTQLAENADRLATSSLFN